MANGDSPYEISESVAYRRAIIELARTDYRVKEGELEIDDDAVASHGFDNGVYVQAWMWVDFANTALDKRTGVDVTSERIVRESL